MPGIAAMRGVSRESMESASGLLDSTLVRDVDAASLGQDLFGMARIIHSSVALRRAVTDPNADGSNKADIVHRVFSGKVGDDALEIVKGLVGSRWSAARDLADATESLGITAILADAEREKSLDTIEDEIFRFGRIITANPELQQALTDTTRSTQDRGKLVDKLLGLRANPHSVQLVKQAVVDPRGRRLDQSFDQFNDAIAERRQESLALVTTAVPLTRDQSQRLSDALAQIYSREVHLNFDIDPTLIGGIRIQVGNEVIDGSLSSRLEEARRRLAG